MSAGFLPRGRAAFLVILVGGWEPELLRFGDDVDGYMLGISFR